MRVYQIPPPGQCGPYIGENVQRTQLFLKPTEFQSMFWHSLPLVIPSAATSALPAMGVSSFFVPKLAEQGFNVPVRQLEGRFERPLQQRVTAILGHSKVPKYFQNYSVQRQLSILRGLVWDQNDQVLQMALGAQVLCAHEADPSLRDSLVSLLVLKELMDVETLGLTSPWGKITRLDQNAIPYLKLLYSLELTGVIQGISYEYQTFVAGETPQHHDVRRIVVNHRAVLDAPKRMDLTELEILQTLDYGQQVDGDAGPLHDFFLEAFQKSRAAQIKGLTKRASLFVTQFPAGRRAPVSQRTIVEAK